MITTDHEKAERRMHLTPLAQSGEQIEGPGPGFGFIEPPPPYHPGPRRKLPTWAKHLRDLRPLKLVE